MQGCNGGLYESSCCFYSVSLAIRLTRYELGQKKLSAVGFEPTPFRTGALSQRLRPLGQTNDNAAI